MKKKQKPLSKDAIERRMLATYMLLKGSAPKEISFEEFSGGKSLEKSKER